LTTDYNDLFVTADPMSYIAYRSIGYRTLSAWQGAGYDPHSVSEMPHFRSPYLHVDSTFATWLNGHATPVTGVTTDFDGQTRNASTPDIGADEFTGFTPTMRRVPSQYATIQSAINASVHGDTVLVSDGTYYENINFKGKRIVVASTYASTGDTSHISNTIIDGSHATNPDSGSVVYFISGEDTNSVLCGFTVRGGSGTRLLAYNSVEGGGVLCMSGARLVQNMITGNNISGANIYGGGVAAEEGQMLIMEQNVVNGNRLNGGWAVGAGVGVYGMEGIIRGNIISDNTATSQGAGSASHGGGLWCEAGNFVVDDNLIARNKALAPNATQNPSYGGGFVAVNGNMDICNNRIVGNVIQSSGSMRAYGGGISLLAVSTSELGEMVVSGNYIASNTVIGGSSGALLSSGGGISSIDQRPWVNNNIIVKNSAPYGGGFGAIKYYTAGSSGDGPVVVKRGGDRTGTERAKRTPVQTRLLLDAPVLINNTIAYNRATVNGGAIASVGSWTPKVINTIAWGDTGMQEVYGGGVRVLFSNIQGGWPSDSGNIDVDPLFVDTTYRLSDYSSCIGAGRDSVLIGGVLYRVPSLCFYGSPRPNPAGSHPDIGACENPRAIPLTGVDDQPSSVPTAFALQQNYPNPFNPSTSISYQLPVAGQATLKVFDVLGREVATLVNEVKQPGTYSVQWNAPGMASGVYFYRLVAGEFQSIKKMIVLK
jgi:predicted outer membrane repeat protein